MKHGTQTLIAGLLILALVPTLALAHTPPAEGQDAADASATLGFCSTHADGTVCNATPEFQELLDQFARWNAFQKAQAEIDEHLGWNIDEE